MCGRNGKGWSTVVGTRETSQGYGRSAPVSMPCSANREQFDTLFPALAPLAAQQLENHTHAVSVAFAQQNNQEIGGVQDRLNSELLGWARNSAGAAANTLDDLLTAVTDTLHDMLAGTPFEAPADGFVSCVLGNKVRGVERAAGWLREHLRITLPSVPDDILQLPGANTLLTPGLNTKLGGAALGYLDTFLQMERAHVRNDLLAALMVLALYLAILVLCALLATGMRLVAVKHEDKEGTCARDL